MLLVCAVHCDPYDSYCSRHTVPFPFWGETDLNVSGGSFSFFLAWLRPWLCKSESLSGRTGLNSGASLSLSEGGRLCSYNLPQYRYVSPSLSICLLCASSLVSLVRWELGDLMHAVLLLLTGFLPTNPILYLLCMVVGMSVGAHTTPTPGKTEGHIQTRGSFEKRLFWKAQPESLVCASPLPVTRSLVV